MVKRAVIQWDGQGWCRAHRVERGARSAARLQRVQGLGVVLKREARAAGGSREHGGEGSGREAAFRPQHRLWCSELIVLARLDGCGRCWKQSGARGLHHWCLC